MVVEKAGDRLRRRGGKHRQHRVVKLRDCLEWPVRSRSFRHPGRVLEDVAKRSGKACRRHRVQRRKGEGG
jgi:hypothetical protein